MKLSNIYDSSLPIQPSTFFNRKMSWLLVIFLFLILLSLNVTSQAEERCLSPDGRFEYYVQEDGTAVIMGWIENSASIEIPAAVAGHPVTTIGCYAFTNLFDAETVCLPEGITTIQDFAFSGFLSLKKINLPSTVVHVGSNPWVNCGDLIEFEIEGEAPPVFLSGGCLYSREDTLIACLEGLCSGDTVSVLPGTRIIGERAFFGLGGDIRHVVLPEGIEEIRAYSLAHLAEVELPSTVSIIGDFAFYGCDMKGIVLPDGLRSIGANPFMYCRNLTSIQFSEEHPRYRVFENALYDLYTHTLISWPLGCKETRPAIQEDTRVIGSYAFYLSEYVEQIHLPEGLQAIEETAFSSCDSLKEINFPPSLQSIGDWAFANCYSLDIPVFPDGLQSIGDYAFRFDPWTEPLILPAGLTGMGADPFAGCDLPFGIEVPESNHHFIVEDGFLYDTDAYKLIKYLSDAEQVRVPDGIRSIGSRAFWQNESVLRVELPASVETIDPHAFDECISMESITFSRNLTVIGTYAFCDCDALTEVLLPDTLTLIDDGAFAFCPALKKVYLAGDHVTISPSAFFMTNATIAGPGGEIVIKLKKNLPLF